MFFSNDILKTVAFLYRNLDDAVEDEDFCAMGFFVGVSSVVDPSRIYLYLATNYHVIEKQESLFVRTNKHSGGFEIVEIEAKHFAIDKESDLAIAVFSATGSDIDINAVPEDSLLKDWREIPSEPVIGIGDELIMVSRLIRQRVKYKSKNLPVARFGSVALIPECEERAFIAEMRSLAGHSGSPVFVYSLGMLSFLRPDKSMFGIKLLGMNRGHLPFYEPVVAASDVLAGNVDEETASLVVATNTSMCQVIPGWKIASLLHGDFLRDKFEQAEEKLRLRMRDQ